MTTYLQRDELSLEDFSQGDPDTPGAIRFTGGAFRQKDSSGVYDPRTVWVTPHVQVPSIAHLIVAYGASGYYRVINKAAGSIAPDSIVGYYDAAKTKTAYRIVYTRNAFGQANRIVTTVYAPDGATVVNTCTEDVVYSGIDEVSRTSVVT